MSVRRVLRPAASRRPARALALALLASHAGCVPLVVFGIVESARVPLYQPGALMRDASARRVGPCVDLRVEQVSAPSAGEVDLVWSYGNRCAHDVVLDTAVARVWFVDARGATYRLPSDAHSDAIVLAALRPGRRADAFREPAWLAVLRPERVCFDVARVVAEATGPAPAPVCVPVPAPRREGGT